MKLEIGYKHDYEIRREIYVTDTVASFSVLFISDLHLNGFSKELVSNLKESINSLNPRIILLGGDYVDTNSGMKYFTELMEFLSARENVFAIAGNHDIFFGLSKISEIAVKNGVTWLDDKSSTINIHNSLVQLSNRYKTTDNSKNDFKIVVLHNPKEIDFVLGEFNLLFAGHLHGCQFVFWETLKGLYPGRLLYKWNVLKKHIAQGICMISKGLGDTLPIRYNCKKDIIFVEIVNKNN